MLIDERDIDGELVDREEPIEEYAFRLVRGVIEESDELDAMIEDVSKNWALSRMPLVDRSILRIACYEFCHVDEVPVGVTINEAVELARAFGGEDDSYRFINGVLGKVARTLEGGDAPAEDAPAGQEGEV